MISTNRIPRWTIAELKPLSWRFVLQLKSAFLTVSSIIKHGVSFKTAIDKAVAGQPATEFFMQHVIFDLDGTVIDSSHRYTALENGGLDLAAWIRDNTREGCMADKLLPAILTMRRDYKAGCKIIVCTARVLSDWDYEFFMANDIPYHVMLDRPEGCRLGDADLKEFQLRLYAHREGISWAKFCQTSMFFEDAETVLNRMAEIGIPTIDANEWNAVLARSHAARRIA